MKRRKEGLPVIFFFCKHSELSAVEKEARNAAHPSMSLSPAAVTAMRATVRGVELRVSSVRPASKSRSRQTCVLAETGESMLQYL